MARNLCTDCNTRRVSTDPSLRALLLCGPCADYSGWENTHSDEGHESRNTVAWDQVVGDDCPVCHPELDPRNTTTRKGHTNTVARTRTSHAACDHAATPRDRAACRKARTPNA